MGMGELEQVPEWPAWVAHSRLEELERLQIRSSILDMFEPTRSAHGFVELVQVACKRLLLQNGTSLLHNPELGSIKQH